MCYRFGKVHKYFTQHRWVWLGTQTFGFLVLLMEIAANEFDERAQRGTSGARSNQHRDRDGRCLTGFSGGDGMHFHNLIHPHWEGSLAFWLTQLFEIAYENSSRLPRPRITPAQIIDGIVNKSVSYSTVIIKSSFLPPDMSHEYSGNGRGA